MSFIERSAGFPAAGAAAWPLCEAPVWRGGRLCPLAPAALAWWHPQAHLALDFRAGRYMRNEGELAAESVLSVTRSSQIRLSGAAGVFETIDSNLLPRTSRGLYANGQFVQSAVNWNAPANETMSLGAGTFTLAVWGSGSVAVAAGTATGSGFGSASEGAPVTFTISGAGTVGLTVTGSPEYVSVTNTAFAPPASNPPGTVFASDIAAMPGARPSNGQPEPFAGWEAAGLDGGFECAARVVIDRLNAASARTVCAAGIDANRNARLFFDTDNRFKARLTTLGSEEYPAGTVQANYNASGNSTTPEFFYIRSGSPVAAGNVVTIDTSGGLTSNKPAANVLYRVRLAWSAQSVGAVELRGNGNAVIASSSAAAGSIEVAASFSMDAAGNRPYIRFTGAGSVTFTEISFRKIVTRYTLQSDAIAEPGEYRIGAVFKPGANALSLDGEMAAGNADATELPAGIAALRIGSNFGNAAPFNGWIEELQILEAA